jgi:hypothetical protein
LTFRWFKSLICSQNSWVKDWLQVKMLLLCGLEVHVYSILASVTASPPPGFETLSMVDLLQYQADHLDFCCVCTTVYLDLVLLCICRCVSATVSTVLYIHYCICCCSSTTVYPPLCICHCVSAAVYICHCFCHCISTAVYPPLCICPCECISWSGTVYLALYLPLSICHCIYICYWISSTVYLPLCLLYCWEWLSTKRDWIIYRTKLIFYWTI